MVRSLTRSWDGRRGRPGARVGRCRGGGRASGASGGAGAGRAELQERDDVGCGEEGVGDRLAGRGRDRGHEAPVGLGHEQRSGGDRRGVQLGETLELGAVGAAGGADQDRRSGDGGGGGHLEPFNGRGGCGVRGMIGQSTR